MSEYLPEAVRKGLEDARRAEQRRKSRMKVRAGGHDFTILRFWDKGFALDAEDAPKLRGFVDLFDGGRHIYQALIVTSSEELGERVFEFKRATPVADRPPADFEVDVNAPAALIPKF